MPKVEVADFVSTLAATHAAAGDFETALQLCEKAIEIWPTEEFEQMRHAFRHGNFFIDRGTSMKKEDFISKEGCGNAKWGMNKLDVRAVFPQMVIDDNDPTTVRGITVKGRKADLELHFHHDRLYRAVVRIMGISAAEVRSLSFKKMEIEETDAKNGIAREMCWTSKETRARLHYDPQRMVAVIELASRTISALRNVIRAGMTDTVQ